MATWNNAFWNSGALWSVVSPSPFANPAKPKTKPNMKRQRYFPNAIAERPEWFGNFAIQLPGANATLALPAADVTARLADAKFCEYASGVWLTATREFGPAATASLDQLFDGAGTTAFVLAPFTPPALPAGVTAVPAGALRRIFAFVQTIKASPNYSDAIGMQLGIIGSEDTTEHPVPEFTLSVERGGGCQCVKVMFKKFGKPGVVVYSRRAGGVWEKLGIDLTSPYLDERPLLVATQPEIREYRLQYFDGDQPTGEMTEVQTVTVSP
ncbi:MAG: hypothetical protein WCF18_05115 [Chthoniobacteraceae bacterium]